MGGLVRGDRLMWIPAPRLREGRPFAGMTGSLLSVFPAKAGNQPNYSSSPRRRGTKGVNDEG